jgi:lipopolysaccharide/colanic/teichoic acid biosynthesis glycosyltransferase
MPSVKRIFDIVFASLGLLVLGPLLLLVAAVVKGSDGGPIFYRQKRVGQFGRIFWIYKIRSMKVNADQMGPSVTQGRDPRITRIGALLRKAKLDELPQLWNVLRGDMSFVGPRPEVPRYVERYTPAQREMLQYKPGITDLASLLFRNEEDLLRTAANVEDFYVRHCLPKKIELNRRYAEEANLAHDIWIILQTLCPYWLSTILIYGIILTVSLWVASLLRFDFNIPLDETSRLVRGYAWIVPVQLLLLLWRQHFTGLLSYFSVLEARQLATALGLSAAVEYVVWLISNGSLAPPRSVIVIQCLVAFLALGAARFGLRQMRVRSAAGQVEVTGGPRRIAIIGADETGGNLAVALADGSDQGSQVVAFFDDDPTTWHKQIHGVPVVGMPENIMAGEWLEKIDEVVLAIP